MPLSYPALESNGGDSMAVKAASQVAQEGVARVGRRAGDDELVAGHADSETVSRSEEGVETVEEPGGGILQVGVPHRVHRALVQHDGELDEKVRQVPRQGRDGARARGVGEGVASLRGRAHSNRWESAPSRCKFSARAG